MNIQLPIEEGYFNIIPITFCGLDAFLITPEIDAKWNSKNLFLRSVIVDKNGKVLSCGFPKFFNYGEKPDCYPDPEKYNDWKIEEKLDGSLVIVDFVNDKFSMRTRGTSSYKLQQNANDFDLLLNKHPKVLNFLKENSHLSLLFEIITPNNVIIIRPENIEFYLLGAINKNGMCVVSSPDLLNIWRNIGCPPSPQQYDFNNIRDLKLISDLIKTWKGKEGIVLSYNNNQNRLKIKSDWYLWLHRIKSKLNSENNLIEYYINLNMPSYGEFYEKIKTDFDFEIAENLKSSILIISEAGEKTKQTIEEMKSFVSSIRIFETRKKQAEHIIATYGSSNRASFVFSMLDGKEINELQLFKLIEQNLKK